MSALNLGVHHDGERFIEPTITNVRINRAEFIRLHRPGMHETNAHIRYSATGTHSEYGEVRFDLELPAVISNLHNEV